MSGVNTIANSGSADLNIKTVKGYKYAYDETSADEIDYTSGHVTTYGVNGATGENIHQGTVSEFDVPEQGLGYYIVGDETWCISQGFSTANAWKYSASVRMDYDTTYYNYAMLTNVFLAEGSHIKLRAHYIGEDSHTHDDWFSTLADGTSTNIASQDGNDGILMAEGSSGYYNLYVNTDNKLSFYPLEKTNNDPALIRAPANGVSHKEKAANPRRSVTYSGSEYVYFSYGTLTWWTDNSAWTGLYVADDQTSAFVAMTKIDNKPLYYAPVPSGSWTVMVFTRMKSGTSTLGDGWANVYKQTVDIEDFSTTNHLWTATGESNNKVNGEWSQFYHDVYGSMDEENWLTDHHMDFKGATCELEIALSANDEFKLRLNGNYQEGDWGASAYTTSESVSEYFSTNNGNIKCLKDGTYTIIFTISTDKFTIEGNATYTVCHGSAETDVAWEDSAPMSINDGVASVTISLAAGHFFKVRRNFAWECEWGWNNFNAYYDADSCSVYECFASGSVDSTNIRVALDGEYTVSLTLETGHIALSGTPTYSLYKNSSIEIDGDLSEGIVTWSNVALSADDVFYVRRNHFETKAWKYAAFENSTGEVYEYFGSSDDTTPLIKVLKDGTYGFSLNLSTGKITALGTPDFTICGSFGGEEWEDDLIPLVWNNDHTIASKTIDVSPNDRFKVRRNETYTEPVGGYGFSNSTINPTVFGYLKNNNEDDIVALYACTLTLTFTRSTGALTVSGALIAPSASSERTYYVDSEVASWYDNSCAFFGLALESSTGKAAWFPLDTVSFDHYYSGSVSFAHDKVTFYRVNATNGYEAYGNPMPEVYNASSLETPKSNVDWFHISSLSNSVYNGEWNLYFQSPTPNESGIYLVGNSDFTGGAEWSFTSGKKMTAVTQDERNSDTRLANASYKLENVSLSEGMEFKIWEYSTSTGRSLLFADDTHILNNDTETQGIASISGGKVSIAAVSGDRFSIYLLTTDTGYAVRIIDGEMSTQIYFSGELESHSRSVFDMGHGDHEATNWLVDTKTRRGVFDIGVKITQSDIDNGRASFTIRERSQGSYKWYYHDDVSEAYVTNDDYHGCNNAESENHVKSQASDHDYGDLGSNPSELSSNISLKKAKNCKGFTFKSPGYYNLYLLTDGTISISTIPGEFGEGFYIIPFAGETDTWTNGVKMKAIENSDSNNMAVYTCYSAAKDEQIFINSYVSGVEGGVIKECADTLDGEGAEDVAVMDTSTGVITFNKNGAFNIYVFRDYVGGPSKISIVEYGQTNFFTLNQIPASYTTSSLVKSANTSLVLEVEFSTTSNYSLRACVDMITTGASASSAKLLYTYYVSNSVLTNPYIYMRDNCYGSLSTNKRQETSELELTPGNGSEQTHYLYILVDYNPDAISELGYSPSANDFHFNLRTKQYEARSS